MAPAVSPPLPPSPPTGPAAPRSATGFGARLVRAFHAYAGWLVWLSWGRFFLLAILLMIVAGVLQSIPPFSWRWPGESWSSRPPAIVVQAPKPPKPPRPVSGDDAKIPPRHVEITIDDNGVRVLRRGAAAASAAAAGASAASAPAAGDVESSVTLKLPPRGASGVSGRIADEVRRAVEEAARDAEEARRDVAEARAEARSAVGADGDDDDDEIVVPRVPRRGAHVGEPLPGLAFLWIVASLIIKITYRRTMQAEASAARAVETAEAESLRRQVVEARMAAMQAQIEPHFLFNTLGSIDHLIETDPTRASAMQKHLIALLRASMPGLRDGAAAGAAPRDLGSEVAVVRPYLELLKMRMEERLDWAFDVPDGLASAEFPSLMLQTLVENAVRHGLEPKPDGGRVDVRARVEHGLLAVTVADTGLGFGGATASAGGGVGLANVRERLALLHGAAASLAIEANPGGGTVATIRVPYRPVAGSAARAATPPASPATQAFRPAEGAA